MKTLAFLLSLAALACAPAALADGYAAPAAQLGPGALSPDGATRYVAAPDGRNTVLLSIRTKDGQLLNEASMLGSYGLPVLAFNAQSDEGVSHDGHTVVLGDTQQLPYYSHFLVYDTRTLRLKDTVVLKGTFAFDALSPDASRLYLIQRPSADLTRYVVRAYDLLTNRLLPGRVADRTQKSWIMQGSAVTRTTSSDGRWVYTLYQNPGGYPFVHALDTVRGVAHCIGIPATQAEQNGFYNVVLTLHGSGLAVHWRSGRPWLNVDLASWKVSPAAGGGFPWLWAWLGLGAVAAAAALALLRRRIVLSEGNGTGAGGVIPV